MTSESSAQTESAEAVPLRVRRAELADAQALHAVAAETFPMACPPGSTKENMDAFVASQLSVEKFRSYLLDPTRSLFLIEREGHPAGYSMVVAAEPSDPDVASAVALRPTIELSKFYVLASGHGRGMAASLMAATLQEAAERGGASIWLGVNEENARANRFYEKHGFVTVGMKRFLLGDHWENDFVKERPLAS